MELKRIALAALAAMSAGMAAYTHSGATAHATDAAQMASAQIIDREGNTIGTAQLRAAPTGVVINIRVTGLPAGKLGMHFHRVGSCSPSEDFKDASGHIMPNDLPHGFFHSEGPHAGNLPNLIVGEDGNAEVELFSNLLVLNQSAAGEKAAILDEDGSSLVIHMNEDDHLGQPIGGSGPRIACGVVMQG